MPEATADWSLACLRLKLIKIGVRVVSHARAITPTSRGGRHRPDGSHYHRRDPPPSRATAMHIKAIHAETEQNQPDKSARCPEKRHLGLGRGGFPVRSALFERLVRLKTPLKAGNACTAGGNQANFTPGRRPLGECRLMKRSWRENRFHLYFKHLENPPLCLFTPRHG